MNQICFFSATTVPDPTQPAHALPKHPSIDSAYGEEGKGIPYSRDTSVRSLNWQIIGKDQQIKPNQ